MDNFTAIFLVVSLGLVTGGIAGALSSEFVREEGLGGLMHLLQSKLSRNEPYRN